MKITGIKVRQVEVPLVEPFRISLGVITHSRSVIVSVETDEGLVGYGEGAPAILITGESLSGTSDVIREMERYQPAWSWQHLHNQLRVVALLEILPGKVVVLGLWSVGCQ